MKIYNQEKTEIIENPDLEKGYLIPDKIVSKVIPPIEAVEEEWHYEYVHYPSGGRDAIKVVDVEGVDAQPETYEYEEIQVYIPYTEEELLNNELFKLTGWFDGYYRTQIEQYNRCQRTGAVYDKDIVALDKQADDAQIRIREINARLKELKNVK